MDDLFLKEKNQAIKRATVLQYSNHIKSKENFDTWLNNKKQNELKQKQELVILFYSFLLIFKQFLCIITTIILHFVNLI